MTKTPLTLRRWLQQRRSRLARWAVPALLSVISATAMAAAPRDRLTLLVPDGADVNSWQVKVWTDTAAEEGITLDLITDSALVALGQGAAGKIAGLVVPDSAHIRASDAVVAAIKQYTFLGGKTMLVYDAGAQNAAGQFPAVGNSRFADLVGLDYVLWDNGAGANTMVGFGQVVGTQARLDALSFPPGKYLPYQAPASLLMATQTTAFVPTSALDPSGAAVMASVLKQRAQQPIEDGSAGLRVKRHGAMRQLLGIGNEDSGMLRYQRRNLNATPARDQHLLDRVARPADTVAATLTANATLAVEAPVQALLVNDVSLHAISGYGYGPLSYYSYVTTGNFPGTVHLSSPEHGLVAGERTYGSGQLLFVNMPLGYFKAVGTDSAPMHGFLGQFARDQVGISTVSVQPRARGGLVYNWHVDDGDDLTLHTKNLLDNTTVLQRGPFSIHFTAGPDVITFGDGNGMNLNNNATARTLVRKLAGQKADGSTDYFTLMPKHALGSHGGWIHDYWGLMANEANVPDLTYLLTRNFSAIENTTGRKIREYSSPVGRTPLWAVDWLEKRGVVAMYLVADLGNGLMRSWRDGARISNKLWTSPVTPLGRYATFEEFDAFGISNAQSGQWLLDLQSFVVNHRTNRMFYNHPPGATGHLDPINALLVRGDTLAAQNKFSWYTMTQLADFSQRRVDTKWTTSTSAGIVTFTATHPNTLADVTRLLPKASYTAPLITSGSGSVSADTLNWIVTADRGTTLRFITSQR